MAQTVFPRSWILLNVLFYYLSEKFVALKSSWLSIPYFRPQRVFVTFNLTAIRWVVFRADSTESALGILERIAEHA